MPQRHRDADDGQRRQGGEHPRKMGRAPRARDDRAKPPLACLAPIFDHVFGHPVSRDDVDLVGDPKLVKRRGGVFHDLPVRIRAHDDSNDCVHALIFSRGARVRFLAKGAQPLPREKIRGRLREGRAAPLRFPRRCDSGTVAIPAPLRFPRRCARVCAAAAPAPSPSGNRGFSRARSRLSLAHRAPPAPRLSRALGLSPRRDRRRTR